MTGPVSPLSPADQTWADLGAELTPAKSLTRVDAVTARAITTITVVGVLLTGLGAVTAGLLTQNGAARVLAAVTVITAAAAVACAPAMRATYSRCPPFSKKPKTACGMYWFDWKTYHPSTDVARHTS